MIGTEKQVKWAEDIKENWINHWNSLVEKVGVKPPKAVLDWVASILENDEAKYWIEYWRGKLDLKKELMNLAEGEMLDTYFDWVELGIGEED